MQDQRPSHTCPHCGRTSYNPNDAAQGYCGACHHFCGDVDDARAAIDRAVADFNTARANAHPVARAVANTLLQLSWWSPENREPEELRQLASQVLGPIEDMTCCPMCQEVTCDADCPMEELRTA